MISAATKSWLQHSWLLVLGMAAIALPTLHYVATEDWTTEQGSHGPLVFASGLWLLVQQWPSTAKLRSVPPMWQVALVAVPLLLIYALSRITAVIEVEAFAMYGVFLTVIFAQIGVKAVRRIWFPLLYLAFVLPLPETFVSMLTNPLKIWISQSSVSLLYALGYPVASAGVVIQAGQYQLLVAAACAGLNSLISLTALTLFYVYVSHRANWKYMLLLMTAAIPVAIFSNLIRVILLILITYHGGESAAQGFLHSFAGMVTFAIALASIYAIDKICSRFLKSKSGEGAVS
jgi:exosortase